MPTIYPLLPDEESQSVFYPSPKSPAITSSSPNAWFSCCEKTTTATIAASRIFSNLAFCILSHYPLNWVLIRMRGIRVRRPFGAIYYAQWQKQTVCCVLGKSGEVPLADVYYAAAQEPKHCGTFQLMC